MVLQSQSICTKTPTGNTGVYSTLTHSPNHLNNKPRLTYRVDWLQGTFPTKYLNKILKFSNLLLGYGEFQERSTGVRYFNTSTVHPGGIIVATGRKIPGGDIDNSLSYIELSGKTLLSIKQSRLRKFMIAIAKKCEFKPTRLDLAIDDFNKSVTFHQLKFAVDNHHYTGFANTVKYHTSGRNASRGWSVSFGNRGSKGGGKYFVIYEKGLESKGKIDSVRTELSCYDHYAIQSFQNLTDLPLALWSELIGGWIKGSINFIHRPKGCKNPSRCSQLNWWKELTDRFTELKPSITYKQSTVSSIKEWLKLQVSSCLSLVLDLEGRKSQQAMWDYFWELISHGTETYNHRHLYILQNS